MVCYQEIRIYLKEKVTMHTYDQLKTLVTKKTGPKELKRLHKKYNKTYTSQYFNTLTLPYFTEIY